MELESTQHFKLLRNVVVLKSHKKARKPNGFKLGSWRHGLASHKHRAIGLPANEQPNIVPKYTSYASTKCQLQVAGLIFA